VRVSTAAAPSGVVTFLFTDVEGSTRRWETDADGMRVALAAHDEVLRNAIEPHELLGGCQPAQLSWCRLGVLHSQPRYRR
jgi:class 3 adenylate cyclase